ncbi:MAG: DUF2905 domain-containing protein [Deltaproteobacteria bacterium]|nr:DUF2905 domain-containing protein [Deltaproteobacteria bacterium]MCX7953117.1 DUF2905 domain-containing protein [Deltaproteobacteria bacterium]
MDELGRILVFLGVGLAIGGLALIFGHKIGLGGLPGDLVFEKQNFKVYIPIATCFVISVILTILVNIFFRK